MGLFQLSQMAEENHNEGISSELIERWRPETHIFYLSHAEMTVTLQDVSCLWGMTIIGEPVTGVEYGDFRPLCINLLGYSHADLQKEKKKGEKIQISPSTISFSKIEGQIQGLSGSSRSGGWHRGRLTVFSGLQSDSDGTFCLSARVCSDRALPGVS